MVKINQLMKYSPEIAKPFREAFSDPITFRFVEISKAASEGIANAQRGLISAQKTLPPLNRHSYYATYFGVRSPQNIQENLKNQMALSWLKANEHNLGVFPSIVLYSNPNQRGIQNALNKLKEKKFGRLTVSDRVFGKDYTCDTHTIGIVYHKGKYFILDSLPETYPQIKDYHERFIKFMGLDPKKVVFSNKPQQNLQEYTCNNWTHANLDAVIDYMKNGGAEKELTPEILDAILPENINKILYHQFLYTDSKLKGRDINELVTEYYSKHRKPKCFEQ